MAGRLLSKVTRSTYMLAARGPIRQAHATALPAALRDEYYPKLGKLPVKLDTTVCSDILHNAQFFLFSLFNVMCMNAQKQIIKL